MWVCIDVAGRGTSGRCCHGFVEYAVTNNAAAGRGAIGRAFRLSIARREDMDGRFCCVLLEGKTLCGRFD